MVEFSIPKVLTTSGVSTTISSMARESIITQTEMSMMENSLKIRSMEEGITSVLTAPTTKADTSTIKLTEMTVFTFMSTARGIKDSSGKARSTERDVTVS